MKKKVTLYTDGACSGNPGLGGYGGILIYGEVSREYTGSAVETTNNRMEVMAVIDGLKRLKYPCIVDIYSDSAYTVNAFTNGRIYAWKKAKKKVGKFFSSEEEDEEENEKKKKKKKPAKQEDESSSKEEKKEKAEK